MIKHSQTVLYILCPQYSFSHKTMGGGGGETLTREGGGRAYFKLWPIGGMLIREEAQIRGFTVLPS